MNPKNNYLLEYNFKNLRFVISFRVETCSNIFNNVQDKHNQGDSSHPIKADCRIISEDTCIHEYLYC